MKNYRVGIIIFLTFVIVAIFFFINLPFDKGKIKILFIGNSYTYRNDMPSIFENIAVSKNKKVFVESCTLGKANLRIQAKRNDVKEAIKSKKWDLIIIQGSSRDFIKDPKIINNKTKPALEKIIKLINSNSSKTKILFYMTWGYRNGFKPIQDVNTFEKMSNRIKERYLELYRNYKYGIVPVGVAWKDVRKKRDEIVLYVKDGAHPSFKGSYLVACCFYSAIFNESPIGSNYYGVLGPKTCYFLQSIATKNVLFNRKKFGLDKIDFDKGKAIQK